MKGIRYIRFSDSEIILGLHRECTDAVTKSSGKRGENCIDLEREDVDLSDVCDINTLKKGEHVPGLYAAHQAAREKRYLTRLMVDYLNKVYVDSDEEDYKLHKKGQKKLERLVGELKSSGLSFDEWMDQYQELGKAKKREAEQAEFARIEADALYKANLEAATEKFAQACFSLPAIAGKMGADIYYTVQVPFAQVPQLFNFNQHEVPVELRAQRQLNDKRAEAIADYMHERQGDFTLPALTASVSESMRFEPAEGFSNIGMVQIPIGATMLINDGQHRASSIEKILARLPHFKDQNISVVLFYDQGLERAQQMFADINDKMVKPPKALNILFDRTNRMNRLVVDSIEEAGFKHAVEFEKASPGSRSSKVWSISALKKAVEILTGLNDKKAKTLSDCDYGHYKTTLVNWFKSFISNTGGALEQDVMNGTSKNLQDARLYRVSTHAVFLHSVAMASRSLCKPLEDYLKDELRPELKDPCPVPDFTELQCLKQLTVLKTADVWRERIVNSDGTMNPTANGIKLGAYVILERLNADIPAAIQEVNDLVFAEAD